VDPRAIRGLNPGLIGVRSRSLIGLPPSLHYTFGVTDLSERAVASRVPSLIDEKLKVLTRRDPLTVRPGTSLQACLELIRETGVADSVFVTDEAGHLEGVLTERDIFGRLVGPDVDLTQPVDVCMVDHPNTLHLDEPVRRAIELMQTGRYRNVPLIDDDAILVGVVRPVDVLKYLAEAFPEELLNLPPRPHQLMDATEGA
jgi:CBS domain-containing protein